MIGKSNVLNIRTSKSFSWAGQTGATRGFCDFEGIEMCRRAGLYLLMRSYRRAGCVTLEEIIKRWAPPTENNTTAYVDYVCKRSGLQRGFVLRFLSDFASVLAAMEIMEMGVPASKREEYFATAKDSYIYIANHFNLKPYES